MSRSRAARGATGAEPLVIPRAVRHPTNRRAGLLQDRGRASLFLAAVRSGRSELIREDLYSDLQRRMQCRNSCFRNRMHSVSHLLTPCVRCGARWWRSMRHGRMHGVLAEENGRFRQRRSGMRVGPRRPHDSEAHALSPPNA